MKIAGAGGGGGGGGKSFWDFLFGSLPKPAMDKAPTQHTTSRSQRGAAGVSMPTIRVRPTPPPDLGFGSIFDSIARIGQSFEHEASHVATAVTKSPKLVTDHIKIPTFPEIPQVQREQMIHLADLAQHDGMPAVLKYVNKLGYIPSTNHWAIYSAARQKKYGWIPPAPAPSTGPTEPSMQQATPIAPAGPSMQANPNATPVAPEPALTAHDHEHQHYLNEWAKLYPDKSTYYSPELDQAHVNFIKRLNELKGLLQHDSYDLKLLQHGKPPLDPKVKSAYHGVALAWQNVWWNEPSPEVTQGYGAHDTTTFGGSRKDVAESQYGKENPSPIVNLPGIVNGSSQGLEGFFSHTLPNALGFNVMDQFATHPGASGQPTKAEADTLDAQKAIANDFTGYKQIENIGKDPLAGGVALASLFPIFKPLRFAGALDEGARAAAVADRGARIASGVDAAKGAFEANRGVIRPILKSMSPTERALKASKDWRAFASDLRSRVPRDQAEAELGVWRRALREVGGGNIKKALTKFQFAAEEEGKPLGEYLAQIAKFHNFSEADTAKVLASKLRGAEKGLGMHGNPRILSAKGHIVVGRPTAPEWVARVEHSIPDAVDRAHWSSWYRTFEPTFRSVFGADAEPLMRAFAVSQANDSPSGGIQAMLRIASDIKRGIPVSDHSYSVVGGNIRDAVKGLTIEKGVAAKLSDFIDALRQNDSRTWMGHDERGGMPAPSDVHAARDFGFVDPKILSRLESEHGIPRDSVKVDNPTGSPSGNRYERVSEWYHEITDHLNQIHFDGRSDWKPAEVQALGWAAIQKFHGVDPQDFETALNLNTKTIVSPTASSSELQQAVIGAHGHVRASGDGWVEAVMGPEDATRAAEELAQQHGETRVIWLRNQSKAKTPFLRVNGEIPPATRDELIAAGYTHVYSAGDETFFRADGKVDQGAVAKIVDEHGLEVNFNGKVQENVFYGHGTTGSGAMAADRGVGAGEERLLLSQRGRPLAGLPDGVKVAGRDERLSFGPSAPIQHIAQEYMGAAKLPYRPPTDYAKVDAERASRIARAYDAMPHAPHDPAVKRSYDAFIKETMQQYAALEKAGYKFEFYPEGGDPYPRGPREAILDLIRNKHMYVFPTDAGFGSGSEFAHHPLLEVATGVKWGDKPVTFNDIFRAVHDVFGHAKEGVGFRADGEENAWRSHVAMYSKEARPAMTAETRGQNSWVNYGPHGETNRTASQIDTVYADQKAGIMPDWVHKEGSGEIEDPQLYQSGDDHTIRGFFQVVEHPNGEVQDGLAARIGLTKHADSTTAIHELGHFLAHFGLKGEALKTIETWIGKPFYDWGVDEHEAFAQGLEAYVRSGAAPNTLKAEFEKLSPVFHEAYPRAGDLPSLPSDVAAVYKKLLGHKDGLPATVYFAVRNKAVAAVLTRAHGPIRDEEEAHQHLLDVAEQLRTHGYGIKASEVPIVKPGEKPEEYAGELGHRIRAHIAGRPDTEGMGTYEAVGAKLDTPAQRIAREKQLEGYSRERGQRAARGSDAFQAAGGGLAGHFAAKGKLTGELSKESTAALDLSSDEADHLSNWIEAHQKLDGKFYARRRAVDSLLKLTRGETLQENEERLLGSIFGKMDNPRSLKADWKAKTWKQRALDLLNVPRSLQATLDQSAAFRHGLVGMVADPSAWAKQWGPMYKQMFSQATHEELMAAIHESPYWPLMDAGVFNDRISFTAVGENLEKREEQFQSNIAEHIPGIGRIVKAGDRGYVGFLNGLRAAQAEGLYMKAAMAGWDLADEPVRGSINRFINSATGRGSLGIFQKHAVTLNTLLFSPRLLWSRLNFLNPLWYAGLHPFARREAWLAMSRLLGLTVGVLAAARAGGAVVVLDPTNADFGKIKLGNTRIDFLGGFQQPIRLAAQMIEGKVTSSQTGKVESLSGGGYSLSRFDILWRFFQNKFAPVPAASVEALQGQDPATHEPLNWSTLGTYKKVILDHMTPLIVQDLMSLPNDKLYLAPLPIVGIGTQDYGAAKTAAAKKQDTWTQTAEKALGEKLPPELIKIRATKTKYEELEAGLPGTKHTDEQRAELLLQIFLEQNPGSAGDKSAFEQWIKADPSGAMSKFEGWLGWSQLSKIDALVSKITKAQAHGG